MQAYGVRVFFTLRDYENGNDVFKIYFEDTRHYLRAVRLDFQSKDTLSFKIENIESEHKEAIPAALNIILYVCAYGLPSRYHGPSGGTVARPKAKKVKGGWRFFPPPQPVTHILGQDVGDAIRKAKT